MGYAELNGQYQRLRHELDAAYCGSVWDSRKIDRIAEEIAQIELALASAQHASPGSPHASFDVTAARHGA